MNSNDLEPGWERIEKLPREGDYDQVRINADCLADIFLGISPDGLRCLILVLPDDFSFDFHPVERDKLSLTKLASQNYVVLTLLNSDFQDLFDDLIVSMYNFIWHVERPDDYSKIFVTTFHKWSKFFDPSEGELLQKSVIQGLFGEIVYLRKLINENPAAKVNDILEAWRGPYDQGHDFILDDRHVEVKTRVVVNSSVRITSEDQLDQPEGKGLELAVVAVDPDDPSGPTLRELVRDTADIVATMLGDISIFYKALSQKNLGLGNLSDYDNFTFKTREIARYDCLDERAFPRIIRSELPEAVFRVTYSLNTSKLEDHLIECETL
jgi:hypothetical protein